MEQIAPEDDLYRRVFPSRVRKNGTLKQTAFLRNSLPDAECSVYLARYVSPADVLALSTADTPMQVAVLSAAVPIGLGLSVRHDPMGAWGTAEYAHAVIGPLTTFEQCERLAEACRVVTDAAPKSS